MPLSFPASPTTGQTSTQNGRQYVWNPPAWELVAASGGGEDARWEYLKPAAPTSVAGTAGNTQVTLTWTAPATPAVPITDYAVQYSTNSGTTWTTFVVTTVSISSQPANQTAASGAATFSVTASVSPSGTATYQWQKSDDGGTTFAAVSGATSATLALTSLTNASDNSDQYRVVVSAVGATAVTSSAATLTVNAAPNAPTSLTATAGNAQIALAWTAPSAPGTSAITGYSVEYTPSGGSAQTVSTGSTSASYTLTGLTNGTAYTVRVAGVSAVGTGAYTAASSSVTPSAASLTVSPSSGTSDIGTAYSWSGSGTAASPLETSDAASPNGIQWTYSGGANTYDLWQFTCGASGTLTFELGAGFDGDGGAERPNLERYLLNGVQSTAFVGASTNVGDHYIRRSISVSSGDVIRLGRVSPAFGFASSEMLKGKIRLWIS